MRAIIRGQNKRPVDALWNSEGNAYQLAKKMLFVSKIVMMESY